MKLAVALFDLTLAAMNVALGIDGLLRLAGVGGPADAFTFPVAVFSFTVAIFLGAAGAVVLFQRD